MQSFKLLLGQHVGHLAGMSSVHQLLAHTSALVDTLPCDCQMALNQLVSNGCAGLTR